MYVIQELKLGSWNDWHVNWRQNCLLTTATHSPRLLWLY